MLRVVKKPGMLKNISHVGRRGGSNLSSAWLGLVTNKAKSLVKARLDTFRLERGSDRKKLEKNKARARLRLDGDELKSSTSLFQAFKRTHSLAGRARPARIGRNFRSTKEIFVQNKLQTFVKQIQL